MNIQEAINTCLSQLDLADATISTYRTCLNLFVYYLGDVRGLTEASPIEQVSMKDFIGYPGWLASFDGYTHEDSKPLVSKNSKVLRMNGVTPLLDWLIENDYLDPSQKEILKLKKARQKISKKHEDKKDQPVAADIMDDVLDALEKFDNKSPAKERNIALILFLYHTGRRRGAIPHLKVKDIQDGRVHTLEKGNKDHYTKMAPQALDAIQAYWDARGWQDPEDPAFARHDQSVGKQHLPIGALSVNHIVDKVEKLANLEPGTLTPHAFRRALITKVSKEYGIGAAQEIAGHKNIETTRRYDQYDQKRRDDIMEDMFKD